MSDPLAEFRARLAAFDVETDLFVPGLAAPPLVCGSTTAEDGGGVFLPRDVARARFRSLLSTDKVVVGANIAFDVSVMLADAEGLLDYDALVELVFGKYDRDEVYDVQVAEALNAIAGGHLFRDPRTGGELIDPHTKRRGRYSLSICVDQVLGRTDAKLHGDVWRKRYAILRDVPTKDWPEEARQYPRDDARNALEVAIVQTGGAVLGATWKKDPHRNLHDMAHQVRAALALQLASCHGMRTDGAAVAKLKATALAKRVAGAARWRELGFLDEGAGKGGGDKKDASVFKSRLARMYGAKSPCPSCDGTGKILNAKGKSQISCNDKNLASVGGLFTDGCDGTGLDLSEAPFLSRTAKGAVQAGRDFLADSGDEELMGFAEYQEDDKVLSVYVPFLEKGVDQPLNPRANVLVTTTRVSYDDVFQQQPRDGGVRECFCARAGCVYCSTDYSSGELSTFAQVLLWVVGYSKMAEVINETEDPGALHTRFAARMLGTTAEELKARIKAGETKAKNYRQAAKKGNFGLGGGMGAVKFVLSNRKKSEGFTLSSHGPCRDHAGNRGYNGLRFCILLGGAERCGVEMVTEWRKKPWPPVCKACVEAAEGLKSDWLSFFDEVPRYFKWVTGQVEGPGEIKCFVSDVVRGAIKFTDASNNGFQALLAAGAKRAAWLIAREQHVRSLNSPLYGTRTCAFFHDEVFSEMGIDIAPAAGVRQAALMVEGLKEFVPDVHVACEPALMRRWSKAAEPVWVDGPAGRTLGVWEPKAVAA